MALKQDEQRRLWVIGSYWAVVLLLGFPLWWFTTLVPRATINESLLHSMDIQFQRDRLLLPRKLSVSLWFVNVDRQVEETMAVEKYHLSTEIRPDTTDTVQMSGRSLQTEASFSNLGEALQKLHVSNGPKIGHWDLYLLPIEMIARAARLGNPTLLHVEPDVRAVAIATDEDLAEVEVAKLVEPIIHRLFGEDTADDNEVYVSFILLF